MATNIEMNILNGNSNYEVLYPKVNMNNVDEILSVINGGTGVTSLDALKKALNVNRIKFTEDSQEYTGNGANNRTINVPGQFTSCILLNYNLICLTNYLKLGGLEGDWTYNTYRGINIIKHDSSNSKLFSFVHTSYSGNATMRINGDIYLTFKDSATNSVPFNLNGEAYTIYYRILSYE